MITEKGKAFIARNFGVNNCSVSEDEVSCTVYTKGEPSERVLNTPTIVFLLVTEIVDWVRTPTGRFTLDDLVAGNDGSYISMTNALDIEPYCIPGAAPPVTPVVTPPVVPLAVAKLPAPRNIRVTNLRSDYAYVEWDAVLECCSDPSEPREYCACEFGIMLNGDPGKKVFADPHPGRDCEELTPGTRYTLEIQTRSPPNIYKYKEPSDKVSFSFTTPAVTHLKDFEIVNPSVNCDSEKCYARFNIKNNSSAASVYIRLEVDGSPRYKRHVYLLRGTTKPQVLSTSIAGLSPGYHNLTIAVGKVTDTDTYTHRFLVGADGIEPPAVAKMTAADIAAVLGRRGPIDTAAVSTTGGKDKWYLVRGKYGGTWLSYVATNFEKSISLDIKARNPPTQASDITLKANHNDVSELDRDWVLARLAELPVSAVAAKITKAEILTELKRKGAIDTAAISTVPGVDRWYMYYRKLNYHNANFEKVIEISNLQTRNPPTQVADIALAVNRTSVNELDRNWVLARLAELPVAAVAAAAAPPEEIKAWIVANYGDGTRVTSDGWRKLSDAEMANALAPLPAGYTKADITGSVISWAMDNPNWKTQTICGWIDSIRVSNLTEDHGRYVYQLAKGRTSVSDRIYNLLSPKPSKPSAAFVTEDNGRGVFQYAKGRKTTGNKITRCIF